MAYLTRAVAAISLLSLGAIGVVGFLTVQRVDEDALQRQIDFVRVALEELKQRLPETQDSSAVWDEAVTNLQANDQAWMAENLVDWMSDYYDIDSVFVLDPQDRVVRGAKDGQPVAAAAFDAERPALARLVGAVRTDLADGEDEIEPVEDFVRLSNGAVALASVRPIVPSTAAVTQEPGSEYLHVAIERLDGATATGIANKYGLHNLSQTNAALRGDSASYAIADNGNRILGFYSWLRYRPGLQLVNEIGPIVLGVLGITGVLIALLAWRLRTASHRLKESEADAKFLAFHDPLTRVPNRALFEDRLGRALAQARRDGSRIALHYLDLDRFKHVNDTLGHPAGDELIRQVAARLNGTVREVDTVARLGGDEFAVIQVDVDDERSAAILCERMIGAISVPFDLLGDEVAVGLSIGVVLSESTDEDSRELMRRADIALYQAKGNGRGRYEVFASEMDSVVQQRRVVERDLREALIKDHGLKLVYQPLYQVDGRTLAGVEALARWDHPIHGWLPTEVFIGIAEERGLIDQLGLWVLLRACSFAASTNVPWVAVNVSPLQFRDERLADKILEILAECKLPAGRLELEITEGLLLENSRTIQTTLRRLRSAGIRIALDDFGTGYTSISYLRHYGVDKLKIDRSFVELLGQDRDVESIVRAIIELARAMRMRVCGEGIETPQQMQVLAQMGCEEFQGFLLDRPMSAEDLRARLEHRLVQAQAS